MATVVRILAEDVQEDTIDTAFFHFAAVEPLRPAFRESGDEWRKMVECSNSFDDEPSLSEKVCKSAPMVLRDVFPSHHLGNEAEGIGEKLDNRSLDFGHCSHNEIPGKMAADEGLIAGELEVWELRDVRFRTRLYPIAVQHRPVLA